MIGESASPRVVNGIRNILKGYGNIEHINEILTMHMGPEFILANISVDFIDSTTAQELEATIAEIDHMIKTDFPNVKRVFIESEAMKNHLKEITQQNK